ncbi:MAG TPA: hypothetical protein VK420_15400, partial [Longimicrobium sp.]|nr:hypothetical protein [Longimicrobium sp.]
YYPSGAVRLRATYVAGELEGEVLAYYNRGGVQRREPFAAGKPAGEPVEYDEGGKVVDPRKKPPLWKRVLLRR